MAHLSSNVCYALPRTARPPTRLAVLGDSDSHSFQDTVWFAPGSAERGGIYRSNTFQWCEVLAKLRASEVDLGAWATWGTRRRLARMLSWAGIEARTPRKQDYEHNFAFAGASCCHLVAGNPRQTPALVRLMNREPERWRDGVVVVRIGVVSFGMASSLDQLAADAGAPGPQAKIRACLGAVRASVALIRRGHPTTRIVLVGILDNADFPPWLEKWQSPEELARIAAGLDVFDGGLQAMAEADPHIAFFDDRAWFASHWGRRGADGKPSAYTTVALADGVAVRHAAGDHPSHSVLQDGHAGLAWNALWAQSLVAFCNQNFGTPITPIRDLEVAQFVRLHWPASSET